MPNFTYTARNSSNQVVKGTVSATDRDAATQAITKQGLKPILVKVEGHTTSSKGRNLLKFGGGKVKSRDLVIFTRQLSTMISAGVPLIGDLDTLRDQT
jgi:type IV pilus assembly protein PilC